MGNVFSEQLTYTLELIGPPIVELNEVSRIVKAADWRYEIDLAMEITAQLKAVGEPTQSEHRGDCSVWSVPVTIDVDLTPIDYLDPDYYDPVATRELVSFELSLPDEWELSGWTYGNNWPP